ncbi:MAG: hypothetical protein OFPI_02810 [Osedax symbiont Rs2]|nr:MAG: hypothetical protein OFPI_02810 [Osedax symbiont Rs2]
MIFSIRTKLLCAFGIVLILVAGVSLNTWWQISQAEDIQQRILKNRQPSVLNGQLLTTGINRSLAGLRGYIILGSNPQKAELFKAERLSGWREIDSAMANILELSSHWQAHQDARLLPDLQALIQEFRVAQQEIEDIAHLSTNIPSIHMLATTAAPLASDIISAISGLIELESAQPATEQRKQLLKLLADSRGSFALGLANIRAYLLTGNRQFLDRYEQTWQTNSQRLSDISKVENLFTSSQLADWQKYQTLRSQFSSLPQQMFKLRSKVDWNLANYWLGSKAAPRAQKISLILEKIQQSQLALAQEDNAALVAKTGLLTLVMLLGSGVALIIGVTVSIVFSKKITLSILQAVTRAQEIACGTLTGAPLPINSKDELAQLSTALNDMTASLRGVISKFAVAGKQLSSAAEQLGKSSASTNQSMESQQQETQKAVVAMHQISETVTDVAYNTVQASESAEQASSVSLQGAQAVSETVSSISSMTQTLEVAKEAINKLGDETEGVDGIVSVISGIADQTNLLALNAAIEAARAGEQGRGFAVVADEVRSLAARTQESTQQIQSLLEHLRSGVVAAVEMMGNSHELAQSCLAKANNANTALSDINKNVNSILDRNTQIAVVSEQQSAATKEVNQNIVNINADVELILQNSRETASAAVKAGDLAADMDQMIGQFQVQSQ